MSITKTTNIPEVGDTAVKVMEFNREDAIRFYKIQQEIAEMDERAALKQARREGLQKGKISGSRNTLVSLVRKGILSVDQAAQEAGVTEAEFESLMKEIG